jgi:hypothetical protein
LRNLTTALLLAAAGSAGLHAGQSSGTAAAPALLRTSSALEQSATHVAESDVVRWRAVTLDLAALSGGSSGTTLDLPLFPDVRFSAQLDGIDTLAPGRYVWKGHLAGIVDGDVTFAVTDGVLAGQIMMPGASYRVHRTTAETYVVEQVDTSVLPSEGPPLVPEIPDAAAADPEVLSDDGSQIDVLVVYTPAARSAAGGTAAMHALVDLAVSNANTSYANSGVTQRLRLVYRGEVAYTEQPSNMSSDLSRLRLTSDGFLDDVHALRDTYRADFVSLLTGATDFCGLGYLMTSVNTTFAQYAFNITAWNCAGQNLSFAHELGHNMGLSHDFANAGSAGAYPYSYGYQDPGFFRTVMAYECSSVSCPRVMHFSTQTRTYGGRPTGVAGASENARTLNNTAPTTANFRQSSTPPPCTFSIAPGSVTLSANGGGGTIAVTASAPTCSWTAFTNASFLSITSPSSQTGSASVTWVGTANTSRNARSGSLTIAGNTFTVSQAGVRTAAGDFNGDGRADRTVFSPGSGMWSTQGGAVRQFGLPGDIPVPGDYDGNGMLDTAVYRPSSGDWFVQGQASFNWGIASDVPVPADYNGDGITDAAVFRTLDSAGAQFFVRGQFVKTWGQRGDVPMAADFDGDGKADLAVFRPASGLWLVTFALSNYTTTASYQWGVAGDIPLTGNFDSDGKADLAVYRPSTGEWFIAFSTGTPIYSTFARHVWGVSADTPLALDMDGDRVDDLVIYRRSDATWWTLNRITAAMDSAQFGVSGDVAAMDRPQFRIPPIADFDGDRRADVSVYRPSTGEWFLRFSAANYATSVGYQWGLSGDVNVAGDYDGDGKTDIAVYRPSNGFWFVRFSNTGYATNTALQWGLSGDVPKPADYDGDGRTDLAVYRPSTGQWFQRLSASGYTTFANDQWGLSSDVPVPADYDGDGRADLAVYRPASGEWFVKLSSASGGFIIKQFGLANDVPLPSDWDGDGRADLAVYRPSTGQWFGADALMPIGYTVRQWGLSGDVPLAHDFDGDGVMDSGVFRPSTGQWFVKLSSSATGSIAVQWGLPGDLPMLRTGR